MKMRPFKIQIILLTTLLLASCASSQHLQNISVNLDEYITILARDWPKASAAIREGVGIENLPLSIVEQLDRMDALVKHNNEWLTPEEIDQLDDFTTWSLAFARLHHSGPVLRVIIEQHAPGLLLIPEVTSIFTFTGLLP